MILEVALDDLGAEVPILNGRLLAEPSGGFAAVPTRIPEMPASPVTHRRLQAIPGELEPGGSELVLGDSDLLPFSFLRTGDRMGRAVVKLLRADRASGTGFLVAPGVLLTNHHVLPTFEEAAGTQALANYEPAPPLDPAGLCATVPLRPDRLFATHAELDFTFCGVGGLDHLGEIPLLRDSLGVVPSERVNIIQHPRGRPKEVALQDNKVVKVDKLVIQYCCDTEPGSSGSPVFNNEWKLVALHHASVVVGPTRGRCACGADPSVRYLNEGMRLSAIAAWLETAEAEACYGSEVTVGLTRLFRGIDCQIGFFGALGQRLSDRSAPESIVACYADRAGNLDVGFWNLTAIADPLSERMRVVSNLAQRAGFDLWLFTHRDFDVLQAVCDQVVERTRHAFERIPCAGSSAVPLVALVRRRRKLGVAWVAHEPAGWHLEVQVDPGDPAAPVFEIAAVPGRSSAGLIREFEGWLPTRPAGGDRTSRVLMGEGVNAPVLQTAHRLQPGLVAGLRGCGGAAIIPSLEPALSRIFLAPDLSQTIGQPREIVVRKDREWPPEILQHHLALPIALRIVYPVEQAESRPSGAELPPCSRSCPVYNGTALPTGQLLSPDGTFAPCGMPRVVCPRHRAGAPDDPCDAPA